MKRLFLWEKNRITMNIIITILRIIDKLLEKITLRYIDKVTRTLYPKPHLEDDDEDDNDPILFI